MGKSGRCLISLFALGVIFAYATNYKVPEGFHHTWRLKLFFTVGQVIGKVESAVKYFGYSSFIESLLQQDVEPPASLSKEERYLAGVRTVIYRPKGATDNLPAMVYFHGGGWFSGTAEVMQNYLEDLIRDVGIAVISVDYRLAPKHAYPAQFEDCYKVTDYVINNAQELKVDLNRISIAGDSAGGNLAAAVATKFRDEGKSDAIKMQLLLYPIVQAFDFQMPSFKANKDDGLVRPELAAKAWLMYALGKEGEDHVEDLMKHTHVPESKRKELIKLCGNSELLTRSVSKPTNVLIWNKLRPFLEDPYFVPLVAKDLTGMPPTIVVTMEQDVLKDEGFLYAQRLRESGIEVVHHHIKEGFHGIYSFESLFPVDYLRAHDKVVPDIKKLV